MRRRRYEHSLTGIQRRIAVLVGAVFLAAAGALGVLLGARWWLLSTALALAGLYYLGTALRGRLAADEDAPAPLWLRERVLRGRLFRWLVARRRPPAARR